MTDAELMTAAADAIEEAMRYGAGEWSDLVRQLRDRARPAQVQSHYEWLNEKYADDPDGTWGGHP